MVHTMLTKPFSLCDSPKLQQQPSGSTCVPTCLAMAFDIDVHDIIHDMEEFGIDVDDGLDDREENWYLVHVGIGWSTFANMRGIGLAEGIYLTTVPSLNVTNYTHCVLVVAKWNEDNIAEVSVLDPNNGVPGMKYYDDFYTLPAISFTKLDDFRDLG